MWWVMGSFFKNTSNSVPFNYSHVTLQVPKPQLLKPQASLLRRLYMPCKRNFAGAMWKRCRHRSLQHQFMPIIILSGPKDSLGFNEVCWGDFECQRIAYSPSAGLRGWCWAHARDILQVHMVTGSKWHMTALRPVHTAVFSVRQWQLKRH